MMKDANLKNLERVLKALANKRRLAILRYLKKEKYANVGNIASEIELSFTATSKHLGVLSAVDIVEKEQRSLEMWYTIIQNQSHISKYIISLL